MTKPTIFVEDNARNCLILRLALVEGKNGQKEPIHTHRITKDVCNNEGSRETEIFTSNPRGEAKPDLSKERLQSLAVRNRHATKSWPAIPIWPSLRHPFSLDRAPWWSDPFRNLRGQPFSFSLMTSSCFSAKPSTRAIPQ